MANYTVNSDTILDIYWSDSENTLLGYRSPYTDREHPGSNKKITPWQWDQRSWPTLLELEAIDYAPSIWDPTRNFLNSSYWLSGIGGTSDLLLNVLYQAEFDGASKWTADVLHGYHYFGATEDYLFSDDFVVEQFTEDQLHSGVQYKDLSFKPKVGIPVHVRRYLWNANTHSYGLDKNLRKRVQFAGLVSGGMEADTLNDDETIAFHNIDTSKAEFVLDYTYGLKPRAWLNRDYSDVMAQSGNWNSYEYVGTGDGVTREFHLAYSPVDPVSDFELVTYVDSGGVHSSWNRINSLNDFSNGPVREFKLDEVLGMVSFGNYDSDDATGSGLVPETYNKIIARYTKGIQIEYEPENSRDYVSVRDLDLNPVSTLLDAGFLKLSQRFRVPAYIVLILDYPYSPNPGYYTDMDGPRGKLTATVYDASGATIPRQSVSFELLAPTFGSLSSTVAMTNSQGQATVFYKPPVDVASFSKATTDVTHSGAYTVVFADDLNSPPTESGVLLFSIREQDDVFGIPTADLDNRYLAYLQSSDINKNPSGTDANSQSGIDYEKSYRNQFELPLFTEDDGTDIYTGLKQLVYANDPNAIHPHSGIQMDLVNSPVFPVAYQDVGTVESPRLRLVYDGNLELFDNDIKSYFVAQETATRVRAYVDGSNGSTRVYSSAIDINLNIADKADGVLLCDDPSDVPDGLFTEVNNVLSLSDAEILLTSGELQPTYLSERLFRNWQWHKDASPLESGTVLHYGLDDGTFDDSGPYSITLTNSNVDMVDFGGGRFAAEIDDATDYLEATGGFAHIPYNEGSYGFYWKAPYPDYLLGSGSDEIVTYMLGLDSSFQTNAIQIAAGLVGPTPYLRFAYALEGEVAGLVDDIHIRVDNTNLTDGNWHYVRMDWQYVPGSPTSGDVTVAGYIDGLQVVGTQSYSFDHPIPVCESGFMFMAGFLSYAALGYYDGMHLHSGEHVFNPSDTYIAEYEDYIGWFRRTRKLDSLTLGLETHGFSGDCPAVTPVGYRLKDANINNAATLGQRTFLDLNDSLPAGYYLASGLDLYRAYYGDGGA
jgi:hypothetical protein